MTIYKKLLNVQLELKVPKGQRNNFGNYKYRNSEDILEGVKPLLDEHDLTILINDEIINVEDRFYVKATVTLVDVETSESVTSTAFARESETKKGMDLAQITGSTSSYARKYALNGLFAIDDTKDSDTTNQGEGDSVGNVKNSNISKAQLDELYKLASSVGIDKDTTIKTIKTKYKVVPEKMSDKHYKATIDSLTKIKGDVK